MLLSVLAHHVDLLPQLVAVIAVGRKILVPAADVTGRRTRRRLAQSSRCCLPMYWPGSVFAFPHLPGARPTGKQSGDGARSSPPPSTSSRALPEWRVRSTLARTRTTSLATGRRL